VEWHAREDTSRAGPVNVAIPIAVQYLSGALFPVSRPVLSDTFRDRLADALGASYTLDRELPGGGMSRVFVATEHALSRTVVVKVLRQELAADVNRERFRREIMLVAQLQHPLIVPVLSAGERGDLLWYTMPFVEGESLREEIRRGPPASPRAAVRALHDVLDALAYAHSRGVIHRDIKPGNILRHGQHSLVTDFGVAKALSASLPSSGTTSAGIAIGTPAYMAPEQLAADPSANHRMDIYATGLLVYELLTGTQAFAESSPQATMAAQLTRMPPHLSQVRPDVPPAFAALVMTMLAKNPDDRPQSARAALDELDALVTPTGVIAPAAMPASGRRAWWVATAGAVALAAIALVASRPRQAQRVTVAPPPATATAPVPASAAPGAATTSPTKTATKTATKTGDTKAGDTKVAARRPPATTAAKAPPFLNRRVAILPFRVTSNRQNVVAASQMLLDSLRRAVSAAGYTLANDSELLRLVTQQSMPGGLRRVATDAGFGAVVMLDMFTRADEVQAVTQVLDVWRAQTAAGRQTADIDRPGDLNIVIRDVLRSLDRVSWRSVNDPRRVLMFAVENHSGVSTLDSAARVLDDSLRALVGRAGATALPLDSTARATRDVTERRMLGIRRGAGAIVATSIYRHRLDSVLVRLSVRDMSDEVTFPNVDVRVPIRDVPSAMETLRARFTELLARVNWGPKALQNP
jgi:hypothetical protein